MESINNTAACTNAPQKQNVYACDADYDNVMECCRRMARQKVCEIIDVNAPFLSSEQGRIMLEEQLYGVLLQMFSYVRANMLMTRKEKQRQGIAAAKAKGVHIGRQQKYNAEDYTEVYNRLISGEISPNEAIAEIGTSRTTFLRMRRELEEKGLIERRQ